MIDYNSMVHKALLGVVKEILLNIQTSGLEDDNHLYISFKTGNHGVSIPLYLQHQFPDEMTIVLQHQFWDLYIYDDYFSIKLSFSGRPEALTIPFSALTKILDPSVQFCLQFVAENSPVNALAQASDTASEVNNISSKPLKNNIVDFSKFRNAKKDDET